MKKAAVLLGTVFVLSFFFAGTASAQYAEPCFDWDCGTTNYAQCDFDAFNCQQGGGVWAYDWDFHDGTTVSFGSPYQYHDFAEAPPTTGEYVPVTVTLNYFSSSETPSLLCEWVAIRDIIGPANDISGRCTCESLAATCS